MTHMGNDDNRLKRSPRRNWLLLLVACAGLIPFAAPVSVSSSAPREAPSTMPGPRGPRGNRDFREAQDAPNRERDNTPRGPTTQERDDAIEFFRQHMPYRLRLFDMIPEGKPAKNRMMQMMMERYRRLQRARMEDSATFDLMLQQMELQDNAIELLARQRRTNGEDYERIQTELRDKVRQIIDLSLQERQKRIERLEKQLSDQKARLDQDQANPDALVDQHIQQMRTDADEVGRLRQSLGLRGFGPPPQRLQPATDRATTEPSDSSGR